jgi:hypothetical protein
MMLATSTEHRKLPFVGTRELSASMVPVRQVLAKQIATALDRSVQQREKCGSLLVSASNVGDSNRGILGTAPGTRSSDLSD